MPKRRSAGEGSVYWSPSRNRYIGTVSYGSKPRVRKSVMGPVGDDSKIARLAILERLRAIKKPAKGNTLAGFLSGWVDTADHLRASTRETYRWAADKYIIPSLGHKRISDISAMDVRTFYAGISAGQNTKQKVHILLHRIMEEAVNLELIDRNPVDRVKPPHVPRKTMAFWEPDDIAKFLRAIKDDRLYAMYLLAIATTCGPGELWALRRKDLNLKGGFLSVTANLENIGGKKGLGETKTAARRRRIDLPKVAVEALRGRLAIAIKEGHGASPYIFTAPECGPIDKRNFQQRVWAPLLKKAKVKPIRFYDLRHTANALMAHLGVPIQAAKERMGHSSIRTTIDTYGHMYEGAGKDVAERLDGFFSGILKR